MKLFPSLSQRVKQKSGIAADDEGAVAVEFALTLPIYLAMIGMIIEGSWMVYHQQAVTYAAEEATRFALVNYSATRADVAEVAYSNLSLLDRSKLDADAIVVADTLNDDDTKLISVRITYSYEPLFPVFSFFGDPDTNGFTFTGSSEGFLVESLEPLLLEEIDTSV